MFEISRKSGLRTNLKDNHRALCSLLLCISLLWLFCLVGGSAAKAAEIPDRPVISVGPGPRFAIADFDGDKRPDLASIRAGANSSGLTEYWIQLQLSTTGRQSFRLVAPAGGLWIEARDVNGDHTVDLVLSTAWFNQPIAILLNDGHGSFSRVEPSAFPGAFDESTENLGSSSSKWAIDVVGVPPESRTGIGPEARGLPHGRSPAGSILPTYSEFLVSPFLISHAGRSPPLEVPQF
ncbi:MAG: VCBS repeat-containing protein [Candidatus Acidiferrales bacterium]